MATKPVMVLGIRYPFKKDDILKISKKLTKRTKNTSQIWPEGGTFDVSLCESINECIKAYKPKDKSKKRQQKRENELEIVNLFKREGERYRKAVKKFNEKKIVGKNSYKYKYKDYEVQLDDQCDPPYQSGLYPLLERNIRCLRRR